MTAFGLFVDLVAAFAWPIAIVILALIFQDSIKDLLSRTSSINTFGASMNFGLIRQHQDEVSEEVTKEVETDQSLQYAIENYPRIAIMESWSHVESAARQELERNGLLEPNMRPIQILRTLDRRGLLQGNLHNILGDLRTVRDAVVHENHASVDSEQAREYVALAEHAVQMLQNREVLQSMSR